MSAKRRAVTLDELVGRSRCNRANRTNPLRAEPHRSRTSSRLGETRTDWNAERSEGTQIFPQAARRKIQQDTQLQGECATCGVKQMNGKRLNLKVCQDDPQRTVIYRVGTLVVQNASHTQALGCSPNSRLGGGH